MPEEDDAAGLLAIVFRGAPKLRAFFRFAADLVILDICKIVTWSALPANQLLLHAIFKALRIKDGCYTSNLTTAEHNRIVEDFTKRDEYMVFNTNWNCGNHGLNLQSMCNHNCQLDAAPFPGALAQGLGRTVRVGQLLAVEDFQYNVPNSFQSRMLTQMIQKMIPGAIGELAMDTTTVGDAHSVFSGDEEVMCPEMFFIDGELVSTPDARITPQHKPLTAEELVAHIIETFRGEIIDASEEWTMAQLEEFDFDFECPDIPAILEAAPSQNTVFTAKIDVSFQKSSSL